MYVSFLVWVFLTLVKNSAPLLQIFVINGTYDEPYLFTINRSVEYIIQYDQPPTRFHPRVSVQSNDSTVDGPLMVVVRQPKEVLSWQLPVIVNSDSGKVTFNRTSRTLCPDKIQNVRTVYGPHHLDIQDLSSEYSDSDEGPVVGFSTSSRSNISFILTITSEDDFYIQPSEIHDILISPSEPRFYFYDFPKNSSRDSESNYETVILEVNSEDSVCMTVSIQNASCPIFDLNQDITFEGYWETVFGKGGITISKRKFPHGFFVVFVAKGDDSDCVGFTQTVKQDRTKRLSFIIKPSISYNDYLIAILITIGSIFAFYLLFIIIYFYCSRRGYKPRAMAYVEQNEVEDVVTPTSTLGGDFGDAISYDETEYDTIAEASQSKEVILSKPVLYLSDLARKDPRILKKKSYQYLWHVLTVALFYGLPVVQLVITYQKVLNDTGNQDLCYYNFLCAHPLGFFSDFNHLFSNSGYVSFGLLFVCLVYRREKLHKDITFEKNYGIPQHYGMFYAMGVALIMEGVLSGSYHICPNHSNFQFDSSFMYVMAVLCMVKLYQNRHPDINATAYATFGVLAIAISLGMIGVLEANLYFWIGFTVLHITVCFILTAQVYYFGLWKLDVAIFERVMQAVRRDLCSNPWSLLIPTHRGRMVLLLLGNACNWGLAVLGMYHHERDFATYLLGVFMSNTMLYFFFYIVMKLLHKEKMPVQSFTYLILCLSCACAAMYFFYHKSISWALTPAQSRQFNQECKLLEFYDFHDVWHFLSAIGMFFTFMCLLTLDDNLSHTHRNKIPVF